MRDETRNRPNAAPHPSRARRRLASLVMTLSAWCVAFLAVMALLTVFGDQLGSLPLVLRALVISGMLVALMVNLVMPVLSVAVARWVLHQPPMPSGQSRGIDS